ncbi:MAG TPA: isochorismatase family protein [Myxococcota bacterium]|nr:isochorismatase family protein [Myxococcota bacterium]
MAHPDLSRLTRDSTAVLLVDVQEKLVPSMPPEVMAAVERNCGIWLQAAPILGLPVLVSEQYPKGLGPTVGSLRRLCPAAIPLPKDCFSCADSPEIVAKLTSLGARRVILLGMEAHVCVLQSAVGLVHRGLDVWVAEDATISRRHANWQAGMRLCREAGAGVAPTETLLFRLMQRSGTPEFKAISRLIK